MFEVQFMAVETTTNAMTPSPFRALAWVARGVEVLLVALIAFIAAQAVWFVIYGDAVRSLDLEPETGLGTGRASQVTDLSVLNQAGLFAARESIAPIVAQSVPQTRLNLSLRGVRAGSDPSSGAAFIETPNLGQRSFAAGEEITDGVVLEEIYEDRVIINRRGARESLFISEEAARRAQQAQSTLPAARNPDSPASTSSTTQSDTASPLSGAPDIALAQSLDLEDWVGGLRLAPRLVDGRVSGFRVQPNSHLEVLRAAGLQPGDVISVLNGIDLSDADAVSRALASVETRDSLSLTLERDGVPVVINVPLN